MPEYFDCSLDDIIKRNRRTSRARGGRGREAVSIGRNLGRGGQHVTTSVAARGRGRARAMRGGRARGIRGASRARSRGGAVGRVFRSRGGRGLSAAGSQRARNINNNTIVNRGAAKRKQLAKTAVSAAVSSVRAGSVVKGRPVSLQTKSFRTKRLAALALASKRRALQQLNRANQQLRQTDARNKLVMSMRQHSAPTSLTQSGRAGSRVKNRPSFSVRGRGVARGLRGQRLRTLAPPVGALANYGGRKQKLRRDAVTSHAASAAYAATQAVNAAENTLTVQIKNERKRDGYQSQQHMPYDPENAEMGSSRPPLNRSALNPRIQQEIAAIQARGRLQRPVAAFETPLVSGNDKPTLQSNVASSGRTLNERFTQDRVIY